MICTLKYILLAVSEVTLNSHKHRISFYAAFGLPRNFTFESLFSPTDWPRSSKVHPHVAHTVVLLNNESSFKSRTV